MRDAPDVRPSIDFDAEQIQRMLNALPYYAMLVDEEHTVLLVNQRVAEVFGELAEPLIGSYCPRAIHGCDHPYHGCPLERSCVTGESAEVEIQDEASGKWYASAVYPLDFRSSSGLRLFLHFTRDITERKQAELARALSLEQSNALKHLLEALQSCDSEREILEATLEHLLGLSWVGLETMGAAFLVQGGALRLVVQRNLAPAQLASCQTVALGFCLCGRVAQSGKPITCGAGDAQHERRHAHLPPHGHAVLPLCDRDEVFGVLNLYVPAGLELDGNHRSLLEAFASAAGGALRRQRMQDQLVQNQYRQMQTEKLAALGTLVAGVAHEVNNPLAGLKNCQKWLCRENLAPDRRREYLSLMEDGLNRIQRVMEQLLSYGRLRAPRWSNESLARLLTSSCALLEPALRARRVTLRIEDAPGELRAKVDAAQIQQALTNLLLNALYVTPDGGAIEVRPCRDGALVGIEIQDHGPGIPEAVRSKIEDPFFTTKPEGQGTGLGLSVTRTIVNAHHGALSFRFPPAGGTIACIMVRGDETEG